MKMKHWFPGTIIMMLAFAGEAPGQPAAQLQVRPQVVGRPIRDGQVTTVYLAPRFATAINQAMKMQPPVACARGTVRRERQLQPCSEQKLERQLAHTRQAGRSVQLSKLLTAERGVGLPEIGMVEDVEILRAELQTQPLVDGCVLHHRDVHVGKAGSAHIRKCARYVSVSEGGGLRECTGIEPAADLLVARAVGGQRGALAGRVGAGAAIWNRGR